MNDIFEHLTMEMPSLLRLKCMTVYIEFHPSSSHQYLAHNTVTLWCCLPLLKPISRKLAGLKLFLLYLVKLNRFDV